MAIHGGGFASGGLEEITTFGMGRVGRIPRVEYGEEPELLSVSVNVKKLSDTLLSSTGGGGLTVGIILLKEYHNFATVFSKSKASILADHHPYDLKITLKDGASSPLGPIYSLLQEELLTLCKFIDENTATGFIRPLCSLHGAPVLFIRKKDGSL